MILDDKSILTRTLEKCPKDLSNRHLLVATSKHLGVLRQLVIAKMLLGLQYS